MKAVKRCRLAKNAADFFHHVFVDIKTTGINIAEHNHSSISDYLRIKSLDFTELHISRVTRTKTTFVVEDIIAA